MRSNPSGSFLEGGGTIHFNEGQLEQLKKEVVTIADIPKDAQGESRGCRNFPS